MRFDGPVRDLVASASGRVWQADDPSPDAISCWRTGTGRYHNVGDEPPVGAELVEPSLEDAYYCCCVGRQTRTRPTAYAR